MRGWSCLYLDMGQRDMRRGQGEIDVLSTGRRQTVIVLVDPSFIMTEITESTIKSHSSSTNCDKTGMTGSTSVAFSLNTFLYQWPCFSLWLFFYKLWLQHRPSVSTYCFICTLLIIFIKFVFFDFHSKGNCQTVFHFPVFQMTVMSKHIAIVLHIWPLFEHFTVFSRAALQIKLIP